ncbi:hypothetical protein ACFFJ7_15535 [Pseudochelatococcus lubricantis]|uniref:hypothetical protein n=1 Tax=Pseudochelatococcus lubricantis TaxID=1538102 RepID=UPI0035EC53CE
MMEARENDLSNEAAALADILKWSADPQAGNATLCADCAASRHLAPTGLQRGGAFSPRL